MGVPPVIHAPDARIRVDGLSCNLFGGAGADFVFSKTWRPLTGHTERAFKRQPHFTDQSVVEQTTENGDTVRHPARRVELWQRVGGIGGPIAASFRYLDKTRAQCQ